MIKVEEKMVGVIVAITGLCGNYNQIPTPIFVDDCWKMEEVPFNLQNFSTSLKEVESNMVETDYNGMYKFISGSKEMTYRYNNGELALHFGVFHRDGKVTGWFYHKEGEDKKTQGKFFIVAKKGMFNRHLNNGEWNIHVLGEEFPSQPTLEKAWEFINDKIIEVVDKEGGVSAILLFEMTWAEQGVSNFWGFEKLRDYAHDMGWKIKSFTKKAS